MNKETESQLKRVPRNKPTFPDADLTKPIVVFKMDKIEDCFGQLWDISTKACSVCSDNEICGILTGQKTKQLVKQIEKNKTFLDTSELDCINVEGLKLWLALKSRSVDDLVNKVMKEAKTDDDVAVIEWLKRFIKAEPTIYTKDNIVYTRK